MYLSGFSNKRRNASSCSGVVAAVAVAVSSSKAAPLATGIKCAPTLLAARPRPTLASQPDDWGRLTFRNGGATDRRRLAPSFFASQDAGLEIAGRKRRWCGTHLDSKAARENLPHM